MGGSDRIINLNDKQMNPNFHVQHITDIRNVAKILAEVGKAYHKTFNCYVKKYNWDENYDIRLTTLIIIAENLFQFQIQGIVLKDSLTKPDWWKQNFNIDHEASHNQTTNQDKVNGPLQILQIRIKSIIKSIHDFIKDILIKRGWWKKKDISGNEKLSKIIDNQITHFNQEIVHGVLQMLFLRLESFIKSIYNLIYDETYITEKIDFISISEKIITACQVSKEYIDLIRVINNLKHVTFNDGFFKFDDEDITYQDKEFLFTKDSVLPVEYVTWNYIKFYLIETKKFISAIIESELILGFKEITNPSLHITFVNSSEVYKASEKEVDEAVSNLANLDLNSITDKVIILNEISKIGYIPYLIKILHTGYPIYRARPNNKKVFVNINDLSYVPPDSNKTYKRASTPENTMFYGAITDSSDDGNITINESVVLLSEASSLYRNRDKNKDSKEIKEETITFGKWVVTSDIPLLSIIQHKSYKDDNEWNKEVRHDYHRFIRQFPTIRNQIIKITDFIAKEFAKEVDEGKNHEYMISALFIEQIMNNAKKLGLPIGGVLYPSKQLEGSGLCVAIHPDWVDECMELVGVVETKVYKKEKLIVTNNFKESYPKKGSSTFNLNEITDPENRLPDDIIYKILNGEIELDDKNKIN